MITSSLKSVCPNLMTKLKPLKRSNWNQMNKTRKTKMKNKKKRKSKLTHLI